MSSESTHVPVLTIDGPSGAGKGTVAARLAKQLGWHLLDSGALYRLTALASQQQGIDANGDNESELAAIASTLDIEFTPTDSGVNVMLAGSDVSKIIRTEEVGDVASKVAALPEVRAALLQRQRDFAVSPGVIADGRDMGTVVFPNANIKVFLTASAEERGQRRYKQLLEKGFDASLRALIDDIKARDERDMNRANAPLKAADDALVIDSTSLSIDEVVARIESELRVGGFLA